MESAREQLLLSPHPPTATPTPCLHTHTHTQGPSIHAFRGDADGLLDTLLHSVANPAKPQARSLESFERDLTPYFGSAEPTDSAAPQQR